MKNTGKKALSVLLALLLLASLLPMAALAVVSTTYAEVYTEAELKNALAQDSAVTDIYLGTDIQLTGTLEVKKNVTLDLDEYTLSYNYSIYNRHGAFTAILVDGASLTLQGEGSIFVMGESDAKDNVIGIQLAKGGSLTAAEMDISVYNAGNCGGAYGVWSDTNATVDAKNYTTILARSANGPAGAVYAPSGTLTGEYSLFHAVSGPEQPATATAICGKNVTLKACAVIGQSRHDNPIAGPTYGAQKAIEISTGGTVKIEDDKEWSDSCIYGKLSIPAGSDIQGGYFSADPMTFLKEEYTTEPVDEYLYMEDADGRQKLNFTFHVIPAGQVARVGRTYYTDLNAAFKEAERGDEVELLSDCTLNNIITIPGGTSSTSTAKSLRLNLNGHYIVGSDTAYLIAGDANPLALTIRDTAKNPKASNVPIKVADGSYLTIESGKFDVLPAYNDDGPDAAKHIYITGGWYKNNPSKFVVTAVSMVGNVTDGYYPVKRNTHPVIVVIGDQVTSYENATAAFAYLNKQDTKTNTTVKAIMSFNGPAALSGDVALGEGLDLTMVYNYSYRNASCINKGDSAAKPIIMVNGATITSGDTAASPYALVLDGVDLVVNRGAITAKAINYARMGRVTAIWAKNGDVTVNGGTVVADGYRGYTDRKNETNYNAYGSSYSAAIFDNDAVAIDAEGNITIGDNADILAVGSSATGATVDGDGTRITMTGGAVKALAFCHNGKDNGSTAYPNDNYQYAFGLRVDYNNDMTADISGGTVYANGSKAIGVSNAAGGNSMVNISGGTVTAKGSDRAYGVESPIARISGGEISATCSTPNVGWRSHYNAVGVMLTYPRNAKDGSGPSVAGATISAEDTGNGEACGIFSKGVSEYDADDKYNPQKPELKVNCTVNVEAKAFACAVNNDSGYKTTISGGSYSSVCTEGFADCICAYYTGDLAITDGSFSVQGVEGTSRYSEETYAATCIYNQGDGATTISGGRFLVKDGSGETVESAAEQGTGLDVGEGTGLYRLLRVRRPAEDRYDYEKDAYVPAGTPTLTVSGGLFSDKVSLTTPNVVKSGLQVISSGDSTYPWTVGTPAPIDPGYVGGGATTYTPTITDSAHGKVTADPKAAAAGDTVKLTATPDAGYELDTLTVKDANGKDVALTKNTDGTYSYVQPAGKVTVTATFKESKAEAVRPFTDVKQGDWFYDAVYHCFDKGYFKGVSETKFDPQGTMTRAMFATVLYRMAGEPTVTGENKFADVKGGQWYTDAILWATQAGIVDGYGDGNFGVDDPITREQMVTMLYRYAQSKGQGFQGLWSFKLDFPDASDVSDWALEAMSWMVMNGVIKGKDGKLAPGATATRAEVAQLIMNFDGLAG